MRLPARQVRLVPSWTVGPGLVLLGLFTPQPAPAATQAQYASGWSVSSHADWTSLPPSSHPLGPVDDLCAGGTHPAGGWAELTFPPLTIPPAELVTGIELRFNYLSPSRTNTAQLKRDGAFVGSPRTVPLQAGVSGCSQTAWVSAGGDGDLWDAGLTTADFNAGAVSVRLTQNANTVDLDAVELIVYHGPVNYPPVAAAGGPYTVAETGNVRVSGTGSSDPDEPASGLTYRWDLDENGSFETAGVSPTFSAAALDGPAIQTVSLQVTDRGGLSSSDSATVNVTNVSPTVTVPAVTPAPSDEGVAVTASASFSDPAGAADAPYTCTVDYGDGSGPAAGTVSGSTCTGPPHAYADNGSYMVTVSVRDKDGGTGAAMAVQSVSNVAPTVAAVTVMPAPSEEGALVTATASFTDPAGTADVPYTCTVDYGDGSGPVAGTVNGLTCTGPPHAYGDNGGYTIEVHVADEDGGAGANTAAHQVDNVAPTVSAATVVPGPSEEGAAVTASASFSDPAGAADAPFTCVVDYGDGSGPQTGTVRGLTCTGPSHAYADDGSYTVEVRLSDKDGGTGRDTGAHQVDNVAPTVTAASSSAEECGATADGEAVEVSADFSDPGFDHAAAGTAEDFTASTIGWGDGTVELATVEAATVDETPGGTGTPTTGTLSGRHVYASGGIYTITLTVADDDDGTDSATLTARVTGAGLNDGELQVVGTEGPDVVHLQAQGKGGDIQVQAGFLLPGKRTFPAGDVSSLRVLTCPGDDQVQVDRGLTVPAILEGGAGWDELRAGGGLSLLQGGPGRDHLDAGDAGTVLQGGPGADVLVGGPGDDVLLGEEGDDQLVGQQGDDLLDGGPGLDHCNAGPGGGTVVHCEM